MPVWKDQHSPVPNAVCERLRRLFQKYYPEVSYTNRNLNGIRFEYDVTTYELPPPAGKGKHESRRQRGPKAGGILCSVYLQRGAYAGQAGLFPLGNGQYSNLVRDREGYRQICMAPYSSVINSHLWAVLSYPPDTSDDFIREYNAVMTDFANNKVLDTQQSPAGDDLKATPEE